MKKALLLASMLAVTLGGCRPMSLYMTEPSGPPEYKLGWEDGCDTGLGSVAGIMNKFAFGFKKRPELADNELYKTAWNEGFSYCRWANDPTDKSTWAN